MSDDELNRLIAEKVMGWHVGGYGGEPYWLNGKGMHAWPIDDWQPTQDIAQAWQVVERMRQLGFDFELQWQDIKPLGQDVFASFNAHEKQGAWEHDVPTLAIVLAALRAMGVEVQDG